MEADLQRFYGIDYRDRWRGGLTLRRLKVLLSNLPRESVLRGGWSMADHLIDDLRMVLTSTKAQKAKPHADRPKGKQKQLNPVRLAAGRRRRAERQRQIAAGEIT